MEMEKEEAIEEMKLDRVVLMGNKVARDKHLKWITHVRELHTEI